MINIKKVICIFCTLLFIFSCNINLISAESVIKTSDNKIVWKCKDNILTIYGKGNIKNYKSFKNTPWYKCSFDVKKLL